MARTVIGSVFLNLAINARGLKKGGQEAKKEIRSIRLSIAKAEKAFRRFGKRTKTAGFALGGFATATAFAVKKTVDFGDALAKSARTLGVTSQKLAQWRLDAELSGVAQDKFQDIMEKSVKRFREYASSGSGAFKRIAEAMGITRSQIDGLNNEQLFDLFLSKLKETGSEAAALELTAVGFASKNSVLAAKLAMTTGRAAKEFKKLGLAIRTDDIEKIADEFTVLEHGLRLQMLQTIIDNKDAILKLVTVVNESVPFIANKFADLVDWFKDNPFLSGAAASLGLIGYLLFGKKGALAIGLIVFGLSKIWESAKNIAGVFLKDEENPFMKWEEDIAKLNEGLAETLRLKKDAETPADQSNTPPAASGGSGASFGANIAEQFSKATVGVGEFRTAVEGLVSGSLVQLTEGLGSIASDTTFKALMGDSIKLKEAFKELGARLVSDFVGGLIKVGAQYAINLALSLLFQKKATAASGAAAAAIAAAWTTPATLVSIATLGAAAGIGVGALTGALASSASIVGAFQAAGGGATLGAQSGGFPSDFGRPGARDTVPALIAPREFVLPERATAALGNANLRELQQGRLPAAGGNVSNNISLVVNSNGGPIDAAELVDMIDDELQSRTGVGLVPQLALPR